LATTTGFGANTGCGALNGFGAITGGATTCGTSSLGGDGVLDFLAFLRFCGDGGCTDLNIVGIKMVGEKKNRFCSVEKCRDKDIIT